MKSVMLTHQREPKQRWQLAIDGQTVLDTGSSVAVLRHIRRLRVAMPDVLATTDCWNTDYCLEWDSRTGLWK